MTYTSERTAEYNAAADKIAALNIGDGVTVSLWTDCEAYTIVKKTATSMTLQQDIATLLNGNELIFQAGGFAAHCVNQEIQKYEYERDPDGPIQKITLRRWKDEEGNERREWKRVGTGTFQAGGHAYAGRRKFHDFNF